MAGRRRDIRQAQTQKDGPQSGTAPPCQRTDDRPALAVPLGTDMMARGKPGSDQTKNEHFERNVLLERHSRRKCNPQGWHRIVAGGVL